MPHVNSSGGDDLASTDEVKVYKDEGEEEKRSSENLSEEKLGLVTETEEVGWAPSSFKIEEKLGLSLKFRINFVAFQAMPCLVHRLGLIVDIMCSFVFCWFYRTRTEEDMRVEKRGQGRGEMVSTAVTFFSRNPSVHLYTKHNKKVN